MTDQLSNNHRANKRTRNRPQSSKSSSMSSTSTIHRKSSVDTGYMSMVSGLEDRFESSEALSEGTLLLDNPQTLQRRLSEVSDQVTFGHGGGEPDGNTSSPSGRVSTMHTEDDDAMSIADGSVASTSSLSTKSRPRKQLLTQKSQKQNEAQDGFEMDKTIQKSTIMMKRLRSKSEGKKSETEYDSGAFDTQETQDQTHAHKRQQQSHWATPRDGSSIFSGGSLFLPPANPQMYIQFQPAREDGGCVICQNIYDDRENQIVLCDHCDRGFHQLCYSPVIESKYAEIPDLEWVCYTCTMPLSTTSSQGLSAMTEDMSLTGQQVPQSAKERYLRSMSKAGLVKFISRIEISAPSVKLYPSRLSSPVAVKTDETRLMSATPIDFLMSPSQGESTSQDMFDGLRNQMKFDSLTPPLRTVIESVQSRSNNTIDRMVAKLEVGGQGQGLVGFDPAISMDLSNTSKSTSNQPTTTRQRPSQSQGSGASLGGTYQSSKSLDLPPYEEMIYMAISDLKQPSGSAPKAILDWVQEHYPVPEAFRASCGQAISKAAKKGRLLKEGSLYKLKPGYDYPRRSSRQGLPTTRARSQSYNSAIPLGLLSITATPSDEQINSIIDANLYGMFPGTAFRNQGPMGSMQPYSSDDVTGSGSSGSLQSIHPFSFGPPSQGGELVSNDGTNSSGLVGLGVSNATKARLDQSATDLANSTTPGLSSLGENGVPGDRTSFLGDLQTSSTLANGSLMGQQILPPNYLYGQTWPVGNNGNQSPGVLAGRGVTTPGAILSRPGDNNQSAMQGYSGGPVPQQQVVGAGGIGVAGNMFSNMHPLNSPSYGNLGSITLPIQTSSPLSHSSLIPQFPLGNSPLSLDNSGLHTSTHLGTYQSLLIPRNMQFASLSQQPQQQQPRQLHDHLGLRRTSSTTLPLRHHYGSVSLPASPQEPTSQSLANQALFRDPIRIQQPQQQMSSQFDIGSGNGNGTANTNNNNDNNGNNHNNHNNQQQHSNSNNINSSNNINNNYSNNNSSSNSNGNNNNSNNNNNTSNNNNNTSNNNTSNNKGNIPFDLSLQFGLNTGSTMMYQQQQPLQQHQYRMASQPSPLQAQQQQSQQPQQQPMIQQLHPLQAPHPHHLKQFPGDSGNSNVHHPRSTSADQDVPQQQHPSAFNDRSQ